MSFHKFWSTQPVKGNQVKEDISNEKVNLPPEYKLTTLQVEDKSELIKFLRKHYTRDPKSKFRLLYSKEFIEWQLNYPKTEKEYSVCLKKGNEIYGFVHGRQVCFNVDGEESDLALINFLCLHSDVRNLRLAPILITEIRKRFNRHGIYSAFFTSGLELPFYFSTTHFYHHLINIPKLESLDFCHQLRTDFRPLMRDETRVLIDCQENVEACFEIYRSMAEKHRFSEIHDIDTFKYVFLPRSDIVETLVYVKDGEIIDFGTFFRVDSGVSGSEQCIKTAYLYFYSSKEIVADLIAYARKKEYDLFNFLKVGASSNFVDEYDFYMGTGQLNYYLFNYEVENMQPHDLMFYLP